MPPISSTNVVSFPTISDVAVDTTRCDFQSIPSRMQHQQFFNDSLSVILEKAVFNATDRHNKVLNWKSPDELTKSFDFNLHSQPSTHNELIDDIQKIIKYSVKTGHPYFMNQLFSSVDPYGLVGQWLSDALNCSSYTYEVAPVFTLMEEYILSEVRNLFGFEGDGIFSPGGSIANGYAINCARFYRFPDVKNKGLHGLPRLVIFTSNDAHYSIKKLAAFEGLGMDNVYAVKTDNCGRMDINDLEQQINQCLQQGAVPFIVSATAGTTVLGAFDPIDKISDICKKYNLWLHVDAAWGGAVMFSQKYRHLLKGIEKADSVTFNPHKMLTAPQQCSIFVTRHKNILKRCNSCSAQYLFQKDKFYDTRFDTGDKHIQCGRRVDVLKFWIMWKAKGSDGFEAHVNKIFDTSEYFTEQIRNKDSFKLVLDQPQCTNICFWYLPNSLKSTSTSDSNYKDNLHKIAPKMKERMMKDGSMMITYQPLNDLPNFFRLVIQNSNLNRKDMDYIINYLEEIGHDL